MKHATPVPVVALALALALTAQGSLLGKLLGGLNIQISACPEIVLGVGGEPKVQSSNPACPNYVPPDEASTLSEQTTDTPTPTDTQSQEPSLLPSYRLAPLSELLPAPTNQEPLVAESWPPAPGVPTKCAYVALAPESTAIVVNGLPAAPPVPALENAEWYQAQPFSLPPLALQPQPKPLPPQTLLQQAGVQWEWFSTAETFSFPPGTFPA